LKLASERGREKGRERSGQRMDGGPQQAYSYRHYDYLTNAMASALPPIFTTVNAHTRLP